MSDGHQQQRTAEQAPALSIGLYIGGLLALYGLILLFYGWLGSPNNAKSLGHPFDIWWGAVMLAVGLTVWGLAFAGRRTSKRATATGGGEESPAPHGEQGRDQQAAA